MDLLDLLPSGWFLNVKFYTIKVRNLAVVYKVVLNYTVG